MIAQLKRFFNNLLRGFWGFMRSIISGAEEVVLAQLKDFAMATVRDLATSDLTGDNKRTIAFQKIKAHANEKAIYIKDHWLNLLIEIAVAAIKKTK